MGPGKLGIGVPPTPNCQHGYLYVGSRDDASVENQSVSSAQCSFLRPHTVHEPLPTPVVAAAAAGASSWAEAMNPGCRLRMGTMICAWAGAALLELAAAISEARIREARVTYPVPIRYG